MSGPFGSTGWMYKSGETIDWGGTRGLFAGGTTGNGGTAAGDAASIDYVEMGAGNADAADFGDLSAVRISLGSVSSTARAVFLGGNPSYVNIMQYVTTSTLGDTSDFGDMDPGGAMHGHQVSSGIRGCFSYSRSGVSYSDEIDYITIASTGNSSTFGDIDTDRSGPAGSSNGTRGLFWAGNINATPAHTKFIQYITIASTGDATTFGNMVRIVTGTSACGNADRSICAGGHYGSLQDTIEYVNPASTSDTSDFGNLLHAQYYHVNCETAVRGVIAGGLGNVSYENTISYITFASTGDATDFGNMTVGRYSHAAASGN